MKTEYKYNKRNHWNRAITLFIKTLRTPKQNSVILYSVTLYTRGDPKITEI
jgi:hypothetical protein